MNGVWSWRRNDSVELGSHIAIEKDGRTVGTLDAILGAEAQVAVVALNCMEPTLQQQTISELMDERDALAREVQKRDEIIEVVAGELMPDAMCFECGAHFGAGPHDPECSIGQKIATLERGGVCTTEAGVKMEAIAEPCDRPHPVRHCGERMVLTDQEVQEWHDDGECIDDCPHCEALRDKAEDVIGGDR